MFDQIVNEKTARKPFALALSVSGQAAALGLALLFPLLNTKAITMGRLAHVVPMLRPWGGPTKQPKPGPHRAAPTTGLRLFSARPLMQPSHIPPAVDMTADAPSVGTIPGSEVFAGTSDGIFGAIETNAAPPPISAPPQPQQAKPTPAATPRLRIGGQVQAAKILRQVRPVYPPLARQARISGTVRLEAVISRGGTVESLQVLGGHPLLVPAAIEAVRQWLYQPTLLNGDPVEVLTQIDVNFKLGGE